jgi:hypothetical protein
MNRLLMLSLLALSMQANAALVCGNDTYSEHGQWYVGQDADAALGSIDTVGDVWCVASGAELSFIKQNFVGLRLHRNNETQEWWQGDDAVFIINNL